MGSLKTLVIKTLLENLKLGGDCKISSRQKKKNSIPLTPADLLHWPRGSFYMKPSSWRQRQQWERSQLLLL